MKMLVSKTWPYLLVAALMVAIFFLGSNYGAGRVTAKWEVEKEKDRLAYNKIKGDIDVLNRQHSYEVGQLNSRLQTAKETYESELARINHDYSDRLLKSGKRAEVYQRQAEAGISECRSLASHAARLDSSLEQGRQLVEELGTTVRLRDRQIIELSNQIRADRKLLE